MLSPKFGRRNQSRQSNQSIRDSPATPTSSPQQFNNINQYQYNSKDFQRQQQQNLPHHGPQVSLSHSRLDMNKQESGGFLDYIGTLGRKKKQREGNQLISRLSNR